MPDEEPSHRNRLAGLLFADDVVLLAPAPETLAASMQQISAWADRWEMSIGASKCGVMVIHGDSQRIRSRSWRLQNQEIPIVEKYRYLQGLSHADARRKGTRRRDDRQDAQTYSDRTPIPIRPLYLHSNPYQRTKDVYHPACDLGC